MQWELLWRMQWELLWQLHRLPGNVHRQLQRLPGNVRRQLQRLPGNVHGRVRRRLLVHMPKHMRAGVQQWLQRIGENGCMTMPYIQQYNT